MIMFIPKSNVSFCRWFELYGFFCSMFLCASLIIMRGFVLTNDWMAQTTTLDVYLTLWQRQLLRFFRESSLSPQSCLCHYESQSSKLLNRCIAIVWQKCFSLFSNKTLCQIKIFPALISFYLLYSLLSK